MYYAIFRISQTSLMPLKIEIATYSNPFIRLLIHLFFWSCIAAMYTVSYNRLDPANGWVMVTKDMFAVMTIFYFTASIIIPKWLMKGKYFFSFLWIIVVYIWWALLTYLSCLIIRDYFEPGERLERLVDAVLSGTLFGFFNIAERPFYLLDFVYLVSLPLGLKVMQAFVQLRYQKTVLERDKLALELSFLKSQINPHFLFNTLNNIYVLVTEKHSMAAETIAKLSGIMNYLLHESNRKYVTLDAELDFLNDYLELERLRFEKRIEIITTMDTDSHDYIIVPLILFPFIENAFKHGPKTSIRNAWIHFKINVTMGILRMEVSNRFARTIKPSDYVGGIGINNVQKRLELNYYENYQLNIHETDDIYKITLTLKLEPND